MSVLNSLNPERVFKYFEELSAIPRGSGNMKAIADYCMSFAAEHSLKSVRDEADNVVIFKSASKGYEKAEPIILQGHLDMVCQKTEDREIDFLKDGLELYIDGDFIKAKGTSLGADNGIAVAMVLAVLESEELSHPAIEAVFTTDEEVGMLGAAAMDKSVLTAKKMINLDSEDMDTVTISCAGGSDFKAYFELEREGFKGTEMVLSLKGLKGGHSGICINEGRVNANMLAARILNHLNLSYTFGLISVNGGDKCNAIPPAAEIRIVAEDVNAIKAAAEDYINVIKTEIAEREPQFYCDIAVKTERNFEVIKESLKNTVILALLCSPNGVMEMSAEIEGLVETSLNLGILKTDEDKMHLSFALRSNKKSALRFLEGKLKTYFTALSAETEVAGAYPPWEFNNKSELLKVYKECFTEHFGFEPKVEAIHAGLECGVFADAINGFDGIAIGPQIYDVHTVNEKLSISSVKETFELLIKILAECK